MLIPVDACNKHRGGVQIFFSGPIFSVTSFTMVDLPDPEPPLIPIKKFFDLDLCMFNRTFSYKFCKTCALTLPVEKRQTSV